MNTEKRYPIVLIPERILEGLHYGIDESMFNLPSHPKFRPTVGFPLKPSRTSTRTIQRIKWDSVEFGDIVMTLLVAAFKSLYGIFISAGIFMFLGLLLNATGGDFKALGGLVVLIPIVSILGAFIYHLVNSEFLTYESTYHEYLKPKDIYQKELLLYEKNKSIYERQEAAYNREVEEYRKIIPLLEEKERAKQWQYTFQPSKKFIESINSVKRGTSEPYFEVALRQKLGSKGLFVNVELEDAGYHPDYVFVCKRTGIHIDIEIDEPYTMVERIPIHGKDSGDFLRDNEFVSENWCVVRFTEEQVVLQTDNCLNFLFDLICFLEIKDEHYLEQPKTTDYFDDLPKRWSMKKAKKLAKQNYREDYLVDAGLIESV